MLVGPYGGFPLSALLCPLNIHWCQGDGMGNVGDKDEECLNASLVKLHNEFSHLKANHSTEVW